MQPLRPQQLPALQYLRQRGGYRDRFELRLLVFARRCHQLLQCHAAAAHLLAQQCDVVVQLHVVAVHLVEQQHHRRQRRAEFVRGAGGECGDRQQLLLVQRLFAASAQLRLLLAQRRCHPHHDIGDQHRRQREVEPHADDVQVQGRSCAAVVVVAVVGRRLQ